IILYMKSGLGERYILPGVTGYSFLMVYFFRYIRTGITVSNMPLLSPGRLKFPAGLFAALTMAICMPVLVLNLIISIQWSFDIRQWQGNIIKSIVALALLLLVVLPFVPHFKRVFFTSVLNYKGIGTLIFVALLVNAAVVVNNAGDFAAEGKNINRWFQSIEKHTRGPDFILIVTEDPRYLEWTYG
ncbi:MAG: hypothetical protein GY940_22975, partial [bacterium]|nr:hypothetical protein [bacterium]